VPEPILGLHFKVMLHNLMRWLSAGFALVAVLGSICLLLLDSFPHLAFVKNAASSATPLLLIGTAYISLQPIVRPRPVELLKRLLLGLAFILWGIVQLLPPSGTTTILGDVVVVLFVVDLALIIKTHLEREDWNTP
jgi:hypothetical protein